MNSKCKICDSTSNFIFDSIILKKYKIKYYLCPNCGFLQTEEPFWLEESYQEAINSSDTGILQRNYNFSKIVAVLIYYLFDKNSKFLDYAGGYGIFTRLMRDIGFDFYWSDKYAKNLLSQGFEDNKSNKYTLITCFECFEHFKSPLEEIENILKISKNLVFSTSLVHEDIPTPDKWFYYGLDHGQHISFYQKKTLQYIAQKYNLYYHSFNGELHIFTENPIVMNHKTDNNLFKIFKKKRNVKYLINDDSYKPTFNEIAQNIEFLFNNVVLKNMKSRTEEDWQKITNRIN